MFVINATITAWPGYFMAPLLGNGSFLMCQQFFDMTCSFPFTSMYKPFALPSATILGRSHPQQLLENFQVSHWLQLPGEYPILNPIARDNCGTCSEKHPAYHF